jgi:hypothetical protein
MLYGFKQGNNNFILRINGIRLWNRFSE